MPRPPSTSQVATGDEKMLIVLRNLDERVTGECSAAVRRHEEILGLLQGLHYDFNNGFVEPDHERQRGGRRVLEERGLTAAACEYRSSFPPSTSDGRTERLDEKENTAVDACTLELSQPCVSSTTVKKKVSYHPSTSSLEDIAEPQRSDSSAVMDRLSAASKLAIGKKKRRHAMDKTCLGITKQIVNDDRFELAVAILIFLNAVVLCFEVQYNGMDLCYDVGFSGCTSEASEVWPSAATVFIILDWTFGALYLAEAFMKVRVLGIAYLLDPWSWLDMVCIGAFMIDKIASAVIPVNGKPLRLLRLCRLMRLTKLLRSMESMDSMFVMTTAIRGMSSILCWAVALLLIILMTEALFLCQILHASYFNAASTGRLANDSHRKLYEYFGTFTRSLFSMFELTLANFPPITRLLSEEISEFFMLLCVVHKITIGFAVIGVINGVILQETFKVASIDDTVMLRQRVRSSALFKRKMTALFSSLDLSEDGYIDETEFTLIADIPEVRAWLASMEIETDDLGTLFRLIDHDGDKRISIDELNSRVPRIRGAARCIDVLDIHRKLCVTHSVSGAKGPVTSSRIA